MKRSLAIVALLYSLVATVGARDSGTRGAQVSFGYAWTAAERCADAAEQLGDISKYAAHTLGRAVRLTVPGWKLFKGTDDQLEAKFLAENPCLRKTVPPDRCPDVQRLVNESTVGDSLGTKLRVIFPNETVDMRDKYSERLIRIYCPQLALLTAPAAGLPSPANNMITVFVDVPPEVDGFVPPSMIGIRDTVKSISAAIFKPRERSVVGMARNKDVADVVVRIASRELERDKYTLRATLEVQARTFDFEAVDSDSDAAAKQMSSKVYDWVVENHDRIVRGRKGQ